MDIHMYLQLCLIYLYIELGQYVYQYCLPVCDIDYVQGSKIQILVNELRYCTTFGQRIYQKTFLN